MKALLVLAIIVAPISPLLSGLVGIPIGVTHVSLCLLYLFFYKVNIKSPIVKIGAIWLAYEVAISLATGFYAIYLKQCVALALAMLVASTLTHKDFYAINSLLKRFLVIGLVTSYFSFVAMIIHPVDSPIPLINPDGRSNYIYYLTLSNYRIASFIRPAYIFDEPGAFASLLCLWGLLASLVGRFGVGALLILLCGLITQSLALAIFSFVMLAKLSPSRVLALCLVGIVAANVYISLPREYQVFEFLVGRITEGELSNNSRVEQVNAVADSLNGYRLFFGIKAIEPRDPQGTLDDVSSNPLTPLINFGLFQSLPFYLLIGALAVTAITARRHRLERIGLILVLMQRPYYADVGYSMLIVLVLMLIWKPQLMRNLEKSRVLRGS